MKCDYVRIGDAAAIVCSDRRRRPLKVCCGCRKLTARKQCDWKLEVISAGPNLGKPGNVVHKTCDAWICDGCAVEVGPDKHLCPTHAKEWAAHPKNPVNSAEPSRC